MFYVLMITGLMKWVTYDLTKLKCVVIPLDLKNDFNGSDFLSLGLDLWFHTFFTGVTWEFGALGPIRC